MLQLNENGHWDEQIIASIHRDIVNKYCSITVVVSKIPSLSVEQIILLLYRLLDCRVLASSAGGPGFNPESRSVSYQRCYKNGTSSSLV